MFSILALSSADFSSLGNCMPMPCVRLPEARRGRDPRHATGHGIALGLVGQGQQHVDIIAKTVLALRGHEDAPFCEHGNVGGVQRGLFLDRQLHHAGTGCGGCGAHGWFADIGSVSGRRNRHRAQGRRLTGRAFMWRKAPGHVLPCPALHARRWRAVWPDMSTRRASAARASAMRPALKGWSAVRAAWARVRDHSASRPMSSGREGRSAGVK